MPKKSKGKFKPYYRSMLNCDGAEIYRNPSVALDGTDPKMSLKYLKDIFQDKIDEDVITMVFSECAYDVDQAVETLMKLSNTEDTASISSSISDTSINDRYADCSSVLEISEDDQSNQFKLDSNSKDSFSKYIDNVGEGKSYSASKTTKSVCAGEKEIQADGFFPSKSMLPEQSMEYPYLFQSMPQYNNFFDPSMNYCPNDSSNFPPYNYSQQFLSTPYYMNYIPQFVTPPAPNSYSASIKSPERKEYSTKPSFKNTHQVKSPSKISEEKNRKDNIYKSIVAKIKSGAPVLIILRGLPGSGKSTLARKLRHSGVILSTDDFFVHRGKYLYDITKLDEAHAWNKRRAQKAFVDAKSPIIIDNTNVEAWEMYPYVSLGRKYTYEIFILEPNTPWKFKPRDLSLKNVHGIPKEKIVKMLERYQHNVTVDSIIQRLDNLNLSVKNSPEKSIPKQMKDDKNKKMTSPDSVSFKAVIHQKNQSRVGHASSPSTFNQQLVDYPLSMNKNLDETSKYKVVDSINITSGKNLDVHNKNLKELKSLVVLDSQDTESTSSYEDTVVHHKDGQDTESTSSYEEAVANQEELSKNGNLSSTVHSDQQLFNSNENFNGSVLDVSENKFIDEVNIASDQDVGKENTIRNLEELKSLVEIDSEETLSASSSADADWTDITERDEDFSWKIISQNDLSLPSVTNYENKSENKDSVMHEFSNPRNMKDEILFNNVNAISSEVQTSNLIHDKRKLESEVSEKIEKLSLVEEMPTENSSHINHKVDSDLNYVKVIKSISLNNLNKHGPSQSESNVNNMTTDLVHKENDKISCSLPKSFLFINQPLSQNFQLNESLCLRNSTLPKHDIQKKNNDDTSCLDSKNINSLVTSEPSSNISYSSINNDTKAFFFEPEIRSPKDCTNKTRSASLTSSKSLDVCDPKPQRINKKMNSSKSLDGFDLDKNTSTNFFMLEECQEWETDDCTELNHEVNSFVDFDTLHTVPKPQRKIQDKRESSTVAEFITSKNSDKIDSLDDFPETATVSKVSKIKKRPSLLKDVSLHIDADWKFPEFIPSFNNCEEISEERTVQVCDAFSLTEPSDFVILQKLEVGENVPGFHKILTPSFHSPCMQNDKEINIKDEDNISQTATFEKSTSTDDLASEVEKSEKLSRVQECFPDVCEDDLLHLLELCHGNETWLTNLLLDSGYKYNNPNVNNDTFKIENTESANTDSPALNPIQSFAACKLSFQSNQGDFETEEENVRSDFVITNEMYENQSPIKQKTSSLTVTEEADSKSNEDEVISQSMSDMASISNLQFSLDPAFAYQLEELFGPVVERDCNDFLLPCQRIVQIDMKTAELIHKLWKKSSEKQENLGDSDGSTNKGSKKKRKIKVLNTASPSLSECNGNEPLSLSQIMDMEYALELHKKEKLRKDTDFSTKLKRQELYNLYPGADPTALDEIFESNNYSINDSIKALGEELGEQQMVIQESVMVNYKKPSVPIQKQENVFSDFANSDWSKWIHKKSSDSTTEAAISSMAPTISSEALELRQLAADHFNQRQHFIQKAKDAFHRGMSEVASFYSQQGNEHRQKFKEVNKMASKLIAEQRNDSLSARVLDLHGLYVQEAIPLLDKFIRNWKQAMAQQTYPQTLSVITGQGLHSERGPKLRPSVMEFLKKTGLKFTEVHLGVIDIFLNPE